MTLAMRASQAAKRMTVLSNQPWMQYVWLLLITLLAAALRLYKLGEWSFWIDELYTINHATAHFSSLNLLLQNIPPARNWIPVSVILAAQALNIWGVGEWSARIVAALIGILSIPILYFPTRRMFGEQVALVAVLLLAVAPWHLFWSQNARFYSSVLLFYMLALMAFHFGLERNRLGYFILFYGLLYFAFSERLFAFFIFPVIGVYLAALCIFKFEKPQGLTLRNMLLLGLPILAGAAIELYSRIFNGESRFFEDFDWFFLYRGGSPIHLLGNISFNIGLPLMALAFFGGLFLVLRKDRAGLLMAVNSFVPLLLIILVNRFIFTQDRYVLIILFSWILLAAVAVVELFTHVNGVYKLLAIGVLVLLLADAGGDNVLYYLENHGNRAQWKTAFNMIENRSRPDDIVVTYWPEFRPFYLDREFIQYEDIDVPTLLESGKRYWFVIDAETIHANSEVLGFLEEHAQLVDILYLRMPDDFFLKIYFYDPSQPVPP
jgi:mannosyltransferase